MDKLKDKFKYKFAIPYYFVLLLEYNQSSIQLSKDIFYGSGYIRDIHSKYYYDTLSAVHRTFDDLCRELLYPEDFYDEFYLSKSQSFYEFFLKYNNLDLTKTSIDDLFLRKIDNNKRKVY